MRFTGSVECRRSSGAALVTLVGHDAAGAQVHLSLVGAVPAELPARLDTASVDWVEAQRYRISAGGRTWVVASPKVYLHYDLSEAFYGALPPRPVPLGKRLLWRFVLAAAASRIGSWWLARRGGDGPETPGPKTPGPALPAPSRPASRSPPRPRG